MLRASLVLLLAGSMLEAGVARAEESSGSAAAPSTPSGAPAASAPADPSAASSAASAASAPRLFVTYGIAGMGASVAAASVQGLRWRDSLLYNELKWAPGAGGSNVARGDTALVTAGPLARTELALGERTRDAGPEWLRPLRMVGVELRRAAQPFALRDSDALLGATPHAAGELNVDAGGLEVHPGARDVAGMALGGARLGEAAPALAPPLAAPGVLHAGTASPMRRGDAEFDYAFGLARAGGDDEAMRPGFLARHRIGLSDAIALGVHGAAAGDTLASGVDLGIGLGSFGTIASSAALMRSDMGTAPASTLRYGLARGPLDLRAAYRRVPPEEAAPAAPAGPTSTMPGAGEAQEIGARVTWTLADASAITLQGTHSAAPDTFAHTAVAMGYRRAVLQALLLEGSVGYASTTGTLVAGGSTPAVPDGWTALVNVRLPLDGVSAASPCAKRNAVPSRACGAP